MLFSATQTTKVQDLARISLRPGPLYINVHADLRASTVARLEQGYVVCDSDRRFLLLFTFLKRNRGKKIIVFMSSCNGVKYHGELLNYIDVPVLDLHVSAGICSALSSAADVLHLTGQAEAAEADIDLLRVLQRAVGHPAVHRRGRTRARHPQGRLDHPV
jgi:hypothetical protein